MWRTLMVMLVFTLAACSSMPSGSQLRAESAARIAQATQLAEEAKTADRMATETYWRAPTWTPEPSATPSPTVTPTWTPEPTPTQLLRPIVIVVTVNVTVAAAAAAGEMDSEDAGNKPAAAVIATQGRSGNASPGLIALAFGLVLVAGILAYGFARWIWPTKRK